MELASTVHNAPDFAAVQELFHSRGWTDGLPVVPPTEDAVAACLEAALMPPEHIIGVEPVRGRAVTAEKAAINTVMAGGLPLHFPVIVTALSAMLRDEFCVHGATASTGGCAAFIVINGDERLRLGMDGTFNALGNSDRASAVVGRAVRLCLINLFDVRPGGIDRSALGHPGKFSFCLAEDEEGSPWEPLAAARGVPDGASAVTVMAAGAPRQIMNEWTTEPEEILETFAAEIRANMRQYSIWPGNYAIVMPPQLRDHLAAAGWSRADVQARLFERARIHRREWATVGKREVVGGRGDREYRALPDPGHLLLVAAGGPAGGFGAVIPPWLGDKSRAVTLAVGACLDCEPPPRNADQDRNGHGDGNGCGDADADADADADENENPNEGRAAGVDADEHPDGEAGPMILRVLDPTFEEGAAGFALAPRLAGLEGATVGIISNGKKGTGPFFAHLANLLRTRYAAAEVVLRTKRSFSAPAEPALMEEAAQWSAAISGVGD